MGGNYDPHRGNPAQRGYGERWRIARAYYLYGVEERSNA